MALNSALYTGLSGLDVNQTRLNVVGNNIANANSVAFKSSRALFVPQFYVTDQGATPASADFGGLNPSQRGLGATVGSIQKDFSVGSIEPTGRTEDLAIDGDGFFVVDGTSRRFTRDGSFQLNSNNQLTTQAGDFVMGFDVDANGAVQVGTLSKLKIPLGEKTLSKATTEVEFTGNLSSTAGGASVLNTQNLTTVGGATTPTMATLATNLADSTLSGTALYAVGDVITVNGTRGGVTLTTATLTIAAGTTLQNIADFYNTALGIDTAVGGNGSTIPNPGATLKTGTATNSIQLVVAGNVGASNELTIAAGPDLNFSVGSTGGTPSIENNPAGTPVNTQFQGYDSLGNPITVNITASLASISPAGAIWNFTATSPFNVGDPTGIIGSGTLQFNSQGVLTNTTGSTVTLSRDGTGAASPQTIALDFGNLGGLADSSSALQFTHQDGFPIGTLNSYNIGADGVITGSFSNGLNQTLGQIAIATFRNNAGLSDTGGNLYSASAASGVPVIGTPLQLGAGSVRSGALELSNVDLSTEFTNLIVASTGFSASSRVITTSDQLIQELLNASR